MAVFDQISNTYIQPHCDIISVACFHVKSHIPHMFRNHPPLYNVASQKRRSRHDRRKDVSPPVDKKLSRARSARCRPHGRRTGRASHAAGTQHGG